MSVIGSDLTASWVRVLKLSKLEPGQVVTVLTGAVTDPLILTSATEAARSLGAVVSRVDLLPVASNTALSSDKFGFVGQTPLAGNAAAMAALKASDLVIDLMVLLFSPEQLEILKSGTKILLVSEPPEVLLRLEPRAEERERVLAAAEKLGRAKEMRVTSAAGTDFRCLLGQYGMLTEYGFVDEPGRWDHWPSGFHATWPNEGTSQGRIVLDRGDILLPQKCYVRDPISLTIEGGYVRRIEGGLDAELLTDYIESFDDPEGYAISHLGWGINERARWSALALTAAERTVGMDARSFAGNFLFSMGPNSEAGGNRHTACHLDIPMRRCSVALDGVLHVEEGKLLDEEAVP